MRTSSALLLAALACACSDDPAEPTDAGTDSGTADATEDAAEDANSDVETEVAADSAPDSEEDVVEDTPPDPNRLPEEMPFEIEREENGEHPTDEEVSEFTSAITGLWADSEYFRWVRMTSHGVDASNEEGWFHYALWWQDTQAYREGDTVRWEHTGRADNLTLRSCKVLTNAIAGYMMTGDEDMRWIVEEYSRGLAALAMVTEFGEDDPAPYLQSRAPFTRNHSFETVGGRQVDIDYDPVRRDEDAWNAAIIHNPNNPYWGDVHFVNQRSKDDLPHMFRLMPMLMRAAQDAPDESVREAAELALDYLRGFAQDVIDTGYQIRTKYGDGEPVIPLNEDGVIKDLASLVFWDSILPDAECPAKFSVDMAAAGQSEFECGDGRVDAYENIASTNHYFNYAIIRLFHVSAAHMALMTRNNEAAEGLLGGLVLRSERLFDDPNMPNRDNPSFDADIASYLLTAAAAGMPLTGREARHIQEHYSNAAEHYGAFEFWDPWADGIEDGPFDYKPNRGTTVRPTEIAFLMEYCYSPFRSETGAQVVDCDVVGDRSRWGE